MRFDGPVAEQLKDSWHREMRLADAARRYRLVTLLVLWLTFMVLLCQVVARLAGADVRDEAGAYYFSPMEEVGGNTAW